MISSAEYYTENLYPFQDGVLKHVNELATPFYLTGGTALSRHYFKHRFKEAKRKDAGLDPLLIYELLITIPEDSLRLIKWIHPIDLNPFFDDIKCIANDIFAGRENSVALHGAI